VHVNCAAIPATLIESELFGYEKGSFTGAVGSKPGRVEMANSGTLFLDEIGELDSGVQAKLLHLLQDGTFSRIGGQEDKKVHVRFICATNRDLESEIAAGNFREDLFYRMNVVNLHLPPLRERLEDLPAMALYFLQKYNEIHNCRTAPLSEAAISRMQEYHWPGNIRQLENLIKRYVILGTEACISGDLAEPASNAFDLDIPQDGPVPLKKITNQAVRKLEREIILKVLQTNHWNRRRAAEALKISYRALLYKIRDSGLSPNRATVRAMPAENGPAAQPETRDPKDSSDAVEHLMSIAKVSNA
jgi:two-component system response regulator AtoC